MSIKERLHDNRYLLFALGALLLLSNIPKASYLLYPFELFSTWVHEVCHGIACLGIGGKFVALFIYPDTSGLARNIYVPGKLNNVIVSSAGYLGTTLIGALLLLLQRPTRFSKGLAIATISSLVFLTFWKVQPWTGMLLYLVIASYIAALAFFTPVDEVGRAGTFGFGVLMLLTLLYARDLFTIAFLSISGLLLMGIGLKMPKRFGLLTFSFLAATCGLNALTSIRELFSTNLMVNGQKGAGSDAHSVAEVLFGPHTIWASLWLLTSVVILGWALYRTLTAPTLFIEELDAPHSASKAAKQQTTPRL